MKYKVLTPHGWVKPKNLTPLHTVFVKDKGFVPFEATRGKQILQASQCLIPYNLKYQYDLPFDVVLTVLGRYLTQERTENEICFSIYKEYHFTFLKELCEANNLSYRAKEYMYHWTLTIAIDTSFLGNQSLEKTLSLEGRDVSFYKSIASLICSWFEQGMIESTFLNAVCAVGNLLGEGEAMGISVKNLPKVDGKLLVLSDDLETIAWV